MKSLELLWQWVAEESAAWCRTSTTLDVKTVKSRSNAEGLSFITITLPAFGKDFEKSLGQGFIDSTSFPSYKKVRDGLIPAFLQGIVGQVFDRKTGRLVAEPSVDAIRCVRQLTLMFAKMHIDCTPERNAQAIQGYLDCEEEVRRKDEETSMADLNSLSTMSFLLFGNLFDQVEREFLSEELLPKHGPGSTADKLFGNEKWNLQEWPMRLDEMFPWELFLLPSEREEYLAERPLTLLYPEQERPVKVTLVPKTLKTPRIIAIEPTAMQYAQQALMKRFIEGIENEYVPNDYFSSRRNLIHGMIGFTDQTPNQRLAKEGSIYGNLATLDLSEASDRVSNLHVAALFAKFPHLSKGIQACRSTKASVPVSGSRRETITLHKFASMGSALTFPIEAMVFLTLIFLGIEDELNRTLTRRDVLSFRDRVRVYGDDIVVPVEFVPAVMNRLVAYGYKVNAAKSFWTGMFRESCGKEYFDGADVSIQRVRRVFPSSPRDALEVISLVMLRNRLFSAGYHNTAKNLDGLVEKILPHYPLVQPGSSVLGRHALHPHDFDVDRTHEDTHDPLVKGYVPHSKLPDSHLEGPGALLKWFLKEGDKPFDLDHLERHGRPEHVGIKVRWRRPY